MDDIKKFLTGIIVRWILKLAGMWFVTIGVASGTIEEIIGGIIAILIGMLVSLFQQKKAINMPVK